MRLSLSLPHSPTLQHTLTFLLLAPSQHTWLQGEMVMADKTIVATKSTELTDKLYCLLLDNVVANSTPL